MRASLAPDVAFELLSPSDSLADARGKACAYLANGTLFVVLLEPRSRRVELYRVGGGAESYEGGDGISLEPEMRGFRLNVAAVFGCMEEF